MVQVGIEANDVQALTEQFSPGELVVDLVSGATLSYATILDAQNNLEASSHEFTFPDLFDDVAKVDALQNMTNFYVISTHPGTDETVWDMFMPLFVNDEYYGAVNVGVALDIVASTMRDSILLTVVIAGLTFLVIALVLWIISTGMISSLQMTNDHIALIASKILHKPVPARLFKRKDEIGAMAKGVQGMQDALGAVLKEVLASSSATALSSQELSASTEETSASIQEVASMTNQFAVTVHEMSDNVEHMVATAKSIQTSATEGSSGVERAVSMTNALKSTWRLWQVVLPALANSPRKSGRLWRSSQVLLTRRTY